MLIDRQMLEKEKEAKLAQLEQLFGALKYIDALLSYCDKPEEPVQPVDVKANNLKK